MIRHVLVVLALKKSLALTTSWLSPAPLWAAYCSLAEPGLNAPTHSPATQFLLVPGKEAMTSLGLLHCVAPALSFWASTSCSGAAGPGGDVFAVAGNGLGRLHALSSSFGGGGAGAFAVAPGGAFAVAFAVAPGGHAFTVASRLDVAEAGGNRTIGVRLHGGISGLNHQCSNINPDKSVVYTVYGRYTDGIRVV